MALSIALLPLLAAPAAAHGVGGAQSANIRSDVTGLVDTTAPDAARGGEPVMVEPVEGLDWRILGGDAYLQAENRSGQDVIVLGYELEPYLRIGPDGVFRNQRSPATYLNADRFALTPVPDAADADAEPDWVKVADEPVYAWHDHRAQWMGGAVPAVAEGTPGDEHLLAEWVAPFTIDGRRLGVAGTLRWIPPVAAWPWPLAALPLVTAPVAVVIVGRRGGARIRRAGAAVLGAVTAVAALLAADELLAAPLSDTGDLATAGTQSLLLVAVAAGGAWVAWRGARRAWLGLLASGLALLAFGAAESAALSASQVLTVLPVPLTRLGIAATMVAVVPAALAAAAAVAVARRPGAPVAETQA